MANKLDKQTMELKDSLPEIHGTIRGKYEFRQKPTKAVLKCGMPASVFREMYIRLLPIKRRSICPTRGSIKMLDAYARVFPVKDLNFTIGQMRVPFTIDAHRSPHQQYFANRSFYSQAGGQCA